MAMLTTILWFLLAMGILVTFHEFGHFYVARRCGVKVIRFSIGFGRPLFTKIGRTGTEYVIAAIPLGGYVKMLDEREGKVSPEDLPMTFTQKTVWQRIAIVSAGPIANFILAAFFYFIFAMLGTKGIVPVVGEVAPGSLAEKAQIERNFEIVSIDNKKTSTWNDVFDKLVTRIGDTGTISFELKPFSSQGNEASLSTTRTIAISQWLGNAERPDILGELGLRPTEPKTDWTLKTVISGGAADAAGLIVGDKLIAANGKQLVSWREWVDFVRDNPEKPIDLSIQRNQESIDLELTPEALLEGGKRIGKVGLAISSQWPEAMVREIEYSLIESIQYGLKRTYDQIVVILSFFKKLILLDVSVKNMGGTFTIAQVAGDSAAAGLTYYLSFLAFFSVSLGVFNLLPIPVLDGGHIMFYLIEAIKGSPLSERIQMIGYQIGLLAVVSLMVVVHYNDLVRILA
jgi:regulator of sigma E protease